MSIDATLRVELTLSAGSTPVKLLGCSQVIRETKYTRVTRFVRTTSGPLEQIRLHIPKCFVVKTYHLTGELDTEWSAYNRLKAVQGKVVPKIYGLVGTRTEGNQAIAMEFLDVQDSAETVTGRSELHNVRSALKYCYQKLAECGVCQCDPKTDAVRIVRLHGQMYMRWLLRATFLRASENIIVAQSRTALPVCFLVLDAALAIGAFLFHSAMHFWILFIIGFATCITLTWLSLPNIWRVVVIDFSNAQFHPKYLARTNMNDADSIADELESKMEKRLHSA